MNICVGINLFAIMKFELPFVIYVFDARRVNSCIVCLLSYGIMYACMKSTPEIISIYITLV